MSISWIVDEQKLTFVFFVCIQISCRIFKITHFVSLYQVELSNAGRERHEFVFLLRPRGSSFCILYKISSQNVIAGVGPCLAQAPYIREITINRLTSIAFYYICAFLI